MLRDAITIWTEPLRLLLSKAERVTGPDGASFAVPPDINPIDRRNLRKGWYETDERELLTRFKPARTIIELGANIGFVMHYAAAKLQPGGTYIAVEANPQSQAALEHNMAVAQERHPTAAFRQVAALVGTPLREGAFMPFVQRRDLSSGNVAYLKPRPADRIIATQSYSLGGLIERFAPKDGSPVSVICDIEGGEMAFLYDRPNDLDRVDQLAIEFHDSRLTGRPDRTPGDMKAICQINGFRPVMQAGNRPCYLFRR